MGQCDQGANLWAGENQLNEGRAGRASITMEIAAAVDGQLQESFEWHQHDARPRDLTHTPAQWDKPVQTAKVASRTMRQLQEN